MDFPAVLGAFLIVVRLELRSRRPGTLASTPPDLSARGRQAREATTNAVRCQSLSPKNRVKGIF